MTKIFLLRKAQGNHLGLVVSILLVLFFAIISIIIIGNKFKSNENFKDCEVKDSTCVSVDQCSSCSTKEECQNEFFYSKCESPKDDNTFLVCCPNAYVLEGDKI